MYIIQFTPINFKIFTFEKNLKNKINFVMSNTPLTLKEFKKRKTIISRWLRNRQEYLHNEINVTVLTIMAFEKYYLYSFETINKLNSCKISKDLYNKKSEELKITYNNMIQSLSQSLVWKRQKEINKTLNNEWFDKEDESLEFESDFYDVNALEKMDGSKYIGYTRREYEGSRFGSFPIHDDYSEESWADDKPWE
jgi:hypothetical protein